MVERVTSRSGPVGFQEGKPFALNFFNAAVERKTVTDAYGSFGQGRERFERELERMKEFDYAAVMMEGSWLDILRNPPARSKLNPKTIYASIIAWEQRYGVSFWMAPNRAFGERTTYRILERYYRDWATSTN